MVRLELQQKIIFSLLVVALILSMASLIFVYESNNSFKVIEGTLQNLSNSVAGFQKMSSSLQNINSTLSEKINEISAQINELKFPIQVYDALNRTVFITQQPERVVSIAPSITEILFAINASSLVVGVDDFSNYPPILEKMVANGTIARVGGFSDISLEKVVSLKPDLVIGTTGVQYKFIYQLSQMGIDSISLRTESIDDIFSATLLLGKITGHYNEAVVLVNDLKQKIMNIYETVSTRTTERPSVAYIVWISPLFVAGGSSFWNDAINLAGGVNAFQNVTQAWPMVSWEDLVKANPDFIILSENAGGFSNASQFIIWAKNQPGGDSLNAIKNGRVYMLHGELNDIASRPGPRIAELQLSISLILHPDIYGKAIVPQDLDLGTVMNLTAQR
ncbi:MAG: ABC transporter substrate-binding protein [Thermoprotei archaeon]|nr:ABC transporter substrate-binding protein [Thermoprotei archaeon]